MWASGENSGAFRRYMDEVVAMPKPSAEGAMELAWALVRARDDLWRAILEDPALVLAAWPMIACPPAANARRARITAELARMEVLEPLYRRALRSVHHPTARSAGAYRRRAELVLEAFAWTDADGLLSDAIAAELELARRGIRPAELQEPVRWPRLELAATLVQQKCAALRAAKNRATKASLRLVVAVASRMSRVGGMRLEDMVSEGNIGLMKAVCRFDPRKGVRFSTYAVWWIRHSVRRAICDQGRLVRLPVHVSERLYKVFATQAALATKLGRPPENDEVAKACGMEVDRVAALLRASFWPLSLDAPYVCEEDGEERPIGNLIADRTETAEAQLETRRREDLARSLVRDLDPRRAAILRARFGMGSPEMTLQEIGRELDVSRERVRRDRDARAHRAAAASSPASCLTGALAAWCGGTCGGSTGRPAWAPGAREWRPCGGGRARARPRPPRTPRSSPRSRGGPGAAAKGALRRATQSPRSRQGALEQRPGHGARAARLRDQRPRNDEVVDRPLAERDLEPGAPGVHGSQPSSLTNTCQVQSFLPVPGHTSDGDTVPSARMS